jgi:effector-binding domain-containing protein
VIKIEEIQAKPMIVLYTIEKASTTDEIGQKLGAAYGEMGAFMKKNNLKMAGAPAATYKSQQPPFDFEAWASVNAAPKKGEGRVQFKKIEGGKAVVAHFFGPYEINYKGYEKLMSYIKEKGLTATGTNYGSICKLTLLQLKILMKYKQTFIN